MFITLTDIIKNTQIRINTAHIIGYQRNMSVHDGQEYTAVFLTDREVGVIFVNQSPEQIDKLLGECFITVKPEMT